MAHACTSNMCLIYRGAFSCFILVLTQNLWDPARAEARGWERDLAAGREFYSLFCNACGHHR